MTNTEVIERRVKAIIYDKLRVDENQITLQSGFINDFGADSLDIVDIVLTFEKEFDISIPDDQAEKISTVGEAIEVIGKNIEKANVKPE